MATPEIYRRGWLRMQHCLLVLGVAVQTVQGRDSLAPRLSVEKALQLKGSPINENLATLNQAMGVWEKEGDSTKELVVALVHQYHDLDKRGDDKQFAVAWESDGRAMTEVHRVEMSCPDVELVVPNRGPFAYEARLSYSPNSLHPECSCQPDHGRPCPPGTWAIWNSTGRSFTSPIESHFVVLENEWRELIADPATVGSLTADVTAPVAVVQEHVINRTGLSHNDTSLGCPAASVEPLGSPDVTYNQLISMGMRYPPGHVDGKWCLVRRGGCSETAKVKVCELSGAVGTIIMDLGKFEGDQEVTIRYRRWDSERATKPIVFLSLDEGSMLAGAALSFPGGAQFRVGPDVPGRGPPGYHPGSGVIVHRMSGVRNGSVDQRAYPSLFDTVGWIEVSDIRNFLFVCLPSQSLIKIYDVSNPMVDITEVGSISRACSRLGKHDYRVLDFKDSQNRYRTLLVDPADSGNRLYYYDTNDMSAPRLLMELHLNWEAEEDGLGQVRPGGPGGRYHLITWHCSNLYCGKNHGDNLYIIDTEDLGGPARRVPLPMPSVGTFARDIVCGSDHVCLISLTWDGLVAFDGGSENTVNQFSVITRSVGDVPFGTAQIPFHMNHMRMWSGAQKVYASRLFPRRFYVEHADFRLRPLQVGDTIRALQLKEVYMVELLDYDQTMRPVFSWGPNGELFPGIGGADTSELEVNGGGKTTLLILVICSALVVVMLVLTLIWLMRLRRRSRSLEMEVQSRRLQDTATANTGVNVVVGRPVDASDAADPENGGAAGAAGSSSAVAAGTAEGEPVRPPDVPKPQAMPTGQMRRGEEAGQYQTLAPDNSDAELEGNGRVPQTSGVEFSCRQEPHGADLSTI